jgi:hypothetical protein
MWPPDYRAVQRAVITVGRKQYVTDGVLTCEPGKGLHLAVVSPLGLVTEVACRAGGAGEVLRVTPLFPERWARGYVARDLTWLFQRVRDPILRAQLVDGRTVLETQGVGTRRRYVLGDDESRIEELEVVAGDRLVYRARFSRWREVANWPVPLPSAIQVDAGTYRLDLQVVQMAVASTPPTEQP